MQQRIEQSILSAKTVMAPERLNTQQVHGKNLTDNTFMGCANGIRGFWLPE